MVGNSRMRAYIRYDSKGKLVPGSIILARKMPKDGHWKEISAYESTSTITTTLLPTTTSTTTTAIPNDLSLLFDDIVNVPVADASDVSLWNEFFDLPANGHVFGSVSVTDNTVTLYNAGTINLRVSLFANNTYLTSVSDNGCITLAEFAIFLNATLLTSAVLPYLTTIGLASFSNCTSLIEADLSSCTDLGGTTGDDFVFVGITANTIDLTINASLLTCNDGKPDDDICVLCENNTVTVNGDAGYSCPTTTTTSTSTTSTTTSTTSTSTTTTTTTIVPTTTTTTTDPLATTTTTTTDPLATTTTSTTSSTTTTTTTLYPPDGITDKLDLTGIVSKDGLTPITIKA